MSSTFVKLPEDKLNAAISALLAPLMQELLENRGRGHCMRITDLEDNVMESVCKEIRRELPDANAYILGTHNQEHLPFRITSTKLVELRNPDSNGELRSPLLIFLPTSLRTSAEDSFGVATFEDLSFSRVYDDLVDRLLDRMPAGLANHVRELFSIVFEQQWLFDDNVARVRYLLTALENGVDGETLGASLYELKLVPDFKLYSDPASLNGKLRRNLNAVQSLMNSHKSVRGRVADLALSDRITETKLCAFFDKYDVQDPQDWTPIIATDKSWWSISFDKWIFQEELFLDKVSISVIETDLPLVKPDESDQRLAQLIGQQVLVPNERRKLNVVFEAKPHPSKVNGLDHFTVQIVSQDSGPIGKSKNVKAWSVNRLQCTTSLTKLDKVEFDEGWHFLRILPWTSDGDPIPFELNTVSSTSKKTYESEPFYVLPGGTIAEEPPQRATPIEQTVEHARLRLQLTALGDERDPDEILLKTVSWDEGGNSTKSSKQEVLLAKFDQHGAVQIPVSKMLKSIEQRILSEPKHPSGWRMQINLDTAQQPVQVGLSLPMTASMQSFLSAREQYFSAVRAGKFELVSQGLSVFNTEPQCIAYAMAYLNLVRDLTRQCELTTHTNRQRSLQALRNVLAVDSVHVIIVDFRGRHKEAALVSPTHPLRALWSLCWATLGREWISKLKTSSRDYISSIRTTLLKELSPSAFPVGIPAEDGRIFIPIGDLNSLWGLYAPTTEENSRGLMDEICYALGLADTNKAAAGISGTIIANKIERYLSQHPYVRELSLNIFNPGSAGIVVDSLTELQGRAEYADLRYDIRLFSSDPESPILGESLESLLLPSVGVNEAEDAFSRSSGNHLFSKLILAKHALSDFHAHPEDYPAHISILLDVFPAEELSVIHTPSGIAPLYGLIQDFDTKFSDDESGTFWNKSPIVGSPSAHHALASSFDLLTDLSKQLSYGTATIATSGSNFEAVPMVTLGLTLAQRELIYQIHRISDWVFTIDRNMGIEFFDHGGLKNRPDYLIDYVPAASARATHNLIISSRSNDELASMISPLLNAQGLSISRGQAIQVLASLRSLSGQLALKLISAPTQQTEALGLALARLYLEYQGALSNQVIVPLDAHVDLYRGHGDMNDIGDALSLQRTDLALFDLNLAERTISCNLVEVKCYSQVGDLLAFNLLKERISGQINQSERILQHHFDPGFKQPDRPDRLIKDRQLSQMLSFYLHRSIRYGIFEGEAGKEARAMLQSIYQSYSLQFRRCALIFDFEKSGTEPPEKEFGIEFHRIGKDIIQALLAGCEGRFVEPTEEQLVRKSLSEQLIPSVPKLDSAAFIAPTRERSTEWTRTDQGDFSGIDMPIGGAPRHPDPPKPERKRTKPPNLTAPTTLSLLTEGKQLAVAEVTDVSQHVDFPAWKSPQETSDKGKDYDVILGVNGPTPQYGILGEVSARKIALDLNHTHTISLFGVQGGGKSYTLGTIIEMASMPIQHLNVLPSPLASVIFHYSPTQDYAPEFTSMIQSNNVEDEIQILHERYQATPHNLTDMLILTSSDKVAQRRAEYPGIDVYPIAFSASELKAAHWKFLMGAVGSQSMYMKQINIIMRALRNNLTLDAIRDGIDQSGLSDHLKELAATRLAFAAEYIDDTQRLQDLIRPGRLIIVDLRDEFIEKDEALGLFIVMLQIFSEATLEGKKFNKLVVFDEAHKYIENDELVAGLVEVVREMRHKGTSIMVASQDPPSVPIAVIELSTQIIMHKFNSPAWLKHIQKANAALSELTSDKMSALRTGEAYIWSSKASDSSFMRAAVKVKCRPRVTRHGGATKTAVE